MQLPIGFSPQRIRQYSGRMVVRLPSRGMEWRYDLVGSPEAPPSKRVVKLACKARSRKVEEVALPLPGLTQSEVLRCTFDVRVEPPADMPEDAARALARQLDVVVANRGGKLRDSDDPLRLVMDFRPRKPMHVPAELVVTKSTGGQWRFNFSVRATDPAPDDVLEIQADVGAVERVAIDIYGEGSDPEPFRAYFTLDAAAELRVDPARGTLPPAPPEGEEAGTEPAQVIVTFAPREYGKSCRGRLVVDSPSSRWVFDVVGSQPEYERPVPVRATVDTAAPGRALAARRQRAKHRQRRDFMRENASKASQFHKPEAKAGGFRF